MSKAYKTYDDVLILPQFSTVKSRSEVDISTQIGPLKLQVPVIAANMDTICDVDMCVALSKLGAEGVLHRFWSVVDNVLAARKVEDQTGEYPMCSVGVSETEWDRATALAIDGCKVLVIDVAHGSQSQVADFYARLKKAWPEVFVIVGNFGSSWSLTEFANFLKSKHKIEEIDGVKVGIGPSHVCSTRSQTGIGVPQWSAVKEICEWRKYEMPGMIVIADGGLNSPGSIAKALGVGADAVMIGSMLAGTDETPGNVIVEDYKLYKTYRGSASKDSYEVQGKDTKHRTYEGVSRKVPYKGPVANVINDIAGGLKSSFSYVGARNLTEFQDRAEFIDVSPGSFAETKHYGENK